jgi:DNA-directed RNA polymerase subunit omega
MARITVEDCLKKIDSQYDLVLLAKERTSQLNAGEKSLVPEDNDKNTVISLREIGEGKISIKAIEDAAINKFRKIKNEPTELEDLELEQEDDFDKTYKGEISKSGTAILPAKRIRRMPEKIIASTEADSAEADSAEAASADEGNNKITEEKDKVTEIPDNEKLSDENKSE